MALINVGVGELAVSNNPKDVIKTYALGSCIAVIIFAPAVRAVGLLHLTLPDSSINPRKGKEKPGMFADTGIPQLIRALKRVGYDGSSRLIVKLAGGATIMDPNNIFNIGKRNILATKKILWKYKMGAISEDVGSTISRTITVVIETGKVTISSPGRGQWSL